MGQPLGGEGWELGAVSGVCQAQVRNQQWGHWPGCWARVVESHTNVTGFGPLGLEGRLKAIAKVRLRQSYRDL